MQVELTALRVETAAHADATTALQGTTQTQARQIEEQTRVIGEHEGRHVAAAATLARLTEEVCECERIMATLQEESGSDHDKLAHAHEEQRKLKLELEQALREGREMAQWLEQMRAQWEQRQPHWHIHRGRRQS